MNGRLRSTKQIMRELGLRETAPDHLTIRRQRAGSGFVYLRGKSRIRDPRELRRLARLAMPPAYENVVFATDPKAHLQAMGRDQAGRAQYRYHPDWEKVREMRKARRLARLVSVLPKIRRAVGQYLSKAETTRACAIAAVIDLVSETAIRAGSEAYLRQRGTRGAATLLKSNVTLSGMKIALTFRGKGGQMIEKQIQSRRLAKALKILMGLPGKRLFQFHEAGELRKIRRRDVNAFLREMAGVKLSLKDFRSLIGCGLAIEQLVTAVPAENERKRRSQILEAMRGVAAELVNTPAICRKSYVHAAIVTAFEQGDLHKIAGKNGHRSAAAREKLLTQVLTKVAP